MNSINIEDMKKGLYLVKVTQGDKSVSKLISKQ